MSEDLSRSSRALVSHVPVSRVPVSRVPVAIVGGGPVGLSLALGLARQGVRSVVVEREATTSEYSKAPGIHIRTREVFRQWKVEERFLEAGTMRDTLPLHSAVPGREPLLSADFSDLEDEADRPGILFLEQGETERLLLEAAKESGLSDVRFGAEAVGLVHDEKGARLAVREGGEEYSLDAHYVVGCDGASSFVRRSLGLPFEGITYTLRPVLADVRVEDGRDSLPWPRMKNTPGGLTFTFRLRPGLWRIVHLGRAEGEKGEEVPDEEVALHAGEVLGEGPVEVLWASRFRIHRRSSPRFRVGKVLLAGDAAHVHSPAGGLGMNGGIHDAHNLAWKLAHALRGGDENRLLDSYDTERRAVIVESVSRYTDLNTRTIVQTPAVVREVVFLLWRQAFKVGRIRSRALRRATMIDLDYPPSGLLDTHERSAGVRLPNPLLRSPEGEEVRLYNLLPYAPTLLDVSEESEPPNSLPVDGLPVEKVLRVGAGGYRDASGLLRGLLGGEAGWILVRPDAHVAWARSRLEGAHDATRRSLGVELSRS